MKKFLSLLLVLLCVFAMASCGQGGTTPPAGGGGDNPPAGGEAQTEFDVFEAAAKKNAPTNITTLTTYVGKDLAGQEFTFDGRFVLQVSGNNSIFKFAYDRFATIDEAAADYIVREEGAIAVRDGAAKVQTGGSMGDWEVLVPSLQTLGALNLDKTVVPSDYDLSSDGMELSVKLSREEALAVLGVVIEAQGEILLEAESNGKNVSMVVVSYTSASGAAVRIATSYTYGKQTLDFSEFN